tara:strand:+ start:107 stop:343 length:237 start_codon:yes stop_codon:yes gene_type:complete
MTHTHIDTEGEWFVASRWHIDDVKSVIGGSEYENEPMPSDERLMEYLSNVVGNEYWVGAMNEQLAMDLGDLFEPEVQA